MIGDSCVIGAMGVEQSPGALVDLGTPWVGRQVPPPKQFPWGRPPPRGGALEVLSLGGARKVLNWTQPAEKVSWAGPAETKVSRAGPA